MTDEEVNKLVDRMTAALDPRFASIEQQLLELGNQISAMKSDLTEIKNNVIPIDGSQWKLALYK